MLEVEITQPNPMCNDANGDVWNPSMEGQSHSYMYVENNPVISDSSPMA